MPRTLPFHSTKPSAPHVFHNNTDCPDGKLAEGPQWSAGDGDLPLCQICARLNDGEIEWESRA